jgi:hypothetical protein
MVDDNILIESIWVMRVLSILVFRGPPTLWTPKVDDFAQQILYIITPLLSKSAINLQIGGR